MKDESAGRLEVDEVISAEAYDRLEALAKQWDVTMDEALDRVIMAYLPKRQK